VKVWLSWEYITTLTDKFPGAGIFFRIIKMFEQTHDVAKPGILVGANG